MDEIKNKENRCIITESVLEAKKDRMLEDIETISSDIKRLQKMRRKMTREYETYLETLKGLGL
jgi:hypothetical protein